MGLIKVVNKRDSRVYLRRVLSADPFKVAELKLESGANNVEEEELQLYLQNPVNERFFGAGMLEAVGEAVEGKDEELPKYGNGDLSKLKLKSALRTIKACTSTIALKQWIAQDGRPEVRTALIERHTELAKSSEEPASTEG